MGGSTWAGDAYDDRQTMRRNAGVDAFVHTAAINRGEVMASCHAQMNPYGVMRESRDSAAHPESLAIQTYFDETGSMGEIPKTFQKKLGELMNILLRKGYVEHPQILFGAVGDASINPGGYLESAPLQVGQFESGVEMDDDLSRIYLERKGGGQNMESYELAMYFAARHTVTDCWEKRGKKGYVFLLGDEMPYPQVKCEEVKRIIGDDLDEDIPIQDIIAEVREKNHLFHIIPTRGSNGRDPKVLSRWIELLGREYVIPLEDPEMVAETIALIIGLGEAQINLAQGAVHIQEAGVTARATETITHALVPYAEAQMKQNTPGATAHALPGLDDAGEGNVKRL